jgi:hypothetical protein
MQKGVVPSKDSILEDMKVPFSKFVLAMKLFILAVNKAYKELGIAYNTAHKIYEDKGVYLHIRRVVRG